MFLLLACTSSEPELVTLSFTVEAATIRGTPFGLDDSSRSAMGSGRMAYDLRTDDALWEDERRGGYQHTTSSVFELDFDGLHVSGSGSANVEIEDLDPDTFRFEDGVAFIADADGLPGPMRVQGEERQDVELWFAMTDADGAAFDSDALPQVFPQVLLDPEQPHTFSLDDDGGTVLFQLLTFE